MDRVEGNLPPARRGQSPRNEEQTCSGVDEFANNYRLDDIRYHLRKGARLLDHPHNLTRTENLSSEEHAVLSQEMLPVSTSILSWFADWWLAPAACHIGGIAYGVVEDILWYPLRQQALYGGAQDTRAAEYSLCAGGALLGCWLMVAGNMLCGRRWTLIFACSLTFATAVGIAFSSAPEPLFVFKFLAAIGSGVLTCTIPIYLAELAPARTRGTMMAAWQFNAYIGASLAVLYRYFTQDTRLAILSALATLVLLACCWVSPESPYQLARNENMNEAYTVLRKYRDTDIQSARDLYKLYMANFQRRQPSKARAARTAVTGFFTTPNLARATTAALVMILTRTIPAIISSLTWIQWLSLASGGPAGHLFNGPVILGLIILGFILFFTRALSVTMADSIGRTKVALITMLVMVTLLVIAVPGGYLMSPGLFGLATRVLFLLPYALGDVIPLTYAAELFPLAHREIGMGIAGSAYFAKDMIVQSVVTLFPEIRNPHGLPSDYPFFKSTLFFALLLILSYASVFFFTRETNRRSLDNVTSVFDTPMRNLVRYRAMVQIPYVFRRCILRQRLELQPFEESVYNEGMINLGGPLCS